jgi:hypothetical protein
VRYAPYFISSEKDRIQGIKVREQGAPKAIKAMGGN